jgi:hypothetical protein
VRPHDALVDDCDAFVARLARAHTFLECSKQLTELMNLVAAADPDFRAIAAASKTLAAAMSEEEYFTLIDKHTALVDRVTAKCIALEQAQEFGLLIVLGAKLKELQAQDLSGLPPRVAALLSAFPSDAALVVSERCEEIKRGCASLMQPFRDVPRARQALRQRDELQARLTALKTNSEISQDPDWEAIGRAGNALKAVDSAMKHQPFSQEDYLALVGRHAALVQKARTQCAELAAAGDCATLATVATKLAELTALARSALPQSTVRQVGKQLRERGDKDNSVSAGANIGL